MYGVRVWFTEAGQSVFDDHGPFDYFTAQAWCEAMAGGMMRGERWTHVDRAIIVPWLPSQP